MGDETAALHGNATTRGTAKSGASSGKTIMASILVTEFGRNALRHGDGRLVLYLTHTPILAHMAADEIQARLKQLLPRKTISIRKHSMANMYTLAVDDTKVIVVATIKTTATMCQDICCALQGAQIASEHRPD